MKEFPLAIISFAAIAGALLSCNKPEPVKPIEDDPTQDPKPEIVVTVTTEDATGVTETEATLIKKPYLPDINFPQDGSPSGTSNYSLSNWTIGNIDSSWTVNCTCDGNIFTLCVWVENKLHYSISNNTSTLPRKGWIRISVTKGKYKVEREYEYIQSAR